MPLAIAADLQRVERHLVAGRHQRTHQQTPIGLGPCHAPAGSSWLANRRAAPGQALDPIGDAGTGQHFLPGSSTHTSWWRSAQSIPTNSTGCDPPLLGRRLWKPEQTPRHANGARSRFGASSHQPSSVHFHQPGHDLAVGLTQRPAPQSAHQPAAQQHPLTGTGCTPISASGRREETAMEVEQRVKPPAARWWSPMGWMAPRAACLSASTASPGPWVVAASAAGPG